MLFSHLNKKHIAFTLCVMTLTKVYGMDGITSSPKPLVFSDSPARLSNITINIPATQTLVLDEKVFNTKILDDCKTFFLNKLKTKKSVAVVNEKIVPVDLTAKDKINFYNTVILYSCIFPFILTLTKNGDGDDEPMGTNKCRKLATINETNMKEILERIFSLDTNIVSNKNPHNVPVGFHADPCNFFSNPKEDENPFKKDLGDIMQVVSPFCIEDCTLTCYDIKIKSCNAAFQQAPPVEYLKTEFPYVLTKNPIMFMHILSQIIYALEYIIDLNTGTFSSHLFSSELVTPSNDMFDKNVEYLLKLSKSSHKYLTVSLKNIKIKIIAKECKEKDIIGKLSLQFKITEKDGKIHILSVIPIGETGVVSSESPITIDSPCPSTENEIGDIKIFDTVVTAELEKAALLEEE